MNLAHPRLVISELYRCNLQDIEFLRQPRINPCSLVFENLQLSEQPLLQIDKLLFLDSKHVTLFDFLLVLTNKLNQNFPLLFDFGNLVLAFDRLVVSMSKSVENLLRGEWFLI